MDREEIKRIIPYKEPFLFVDKVEELGEKTIIGYYQTHKDDYYFKGHFVDFPIMPGSLIVEALGQIATILLRKKLGENHFSKHFLAYNIRGVQFRKPIFPGEKVTLRAEVLGFYDAPPGSEAEKFAHILGQAFGGDELKCEARFSIAVVDKKKFTKSSPFQIQKNTMLILSQKEVKKILPLSQIKEVIRVVEEAFADYAQNKVQMPPKSYLYFKEVEGDLRIMPAFSSRLKMAGTKIVNVHPLNPLREGLPTVMATIILNNPQNGLPVALMDGTYITGLRTGAGGAVAVKYLARENASTLGVVGAGEQAFYQIMAITQVREIKEIVVFDIKKEAIEKLRSLLAKENIEIKDAPLEEVVKKDIVVTATPSRKPIIKREWILPGTHINAIGADAEGKEELDPQILKEGKIVIDDWAQATHSGEINVPLKKGMITEADIYASLGEVIIGKKKGRENEEEITIFDSTGLAIQDLYTATLVYQKAKEKEEGREIKLLE